MSKSAISYRVYQYQRVKHKVLFLHERVYPVYIMIVCGRRVLNFKSHLFTHLLRQKYQVSMQVNDWKFSVRDVISWEEKMLAAIISQLDESATAETCKDAYTYASADLTQLMDRQCKEAMISFFNREALPSIALSIRNMEEVLTADLILGDLYTTLAAGVREKLFSQLQPGINLFRFSNRKREHAIPLLTPFEVDNKQFLPELATFLGNKENALACVNYLAELQQTTMNETDQLRRTNR